MRYFEINGGLRMNVSEEEQAILDAAENELSAEELDERDQEIAIKMVSRGLLIQNTKDDKIYYMQNSLPDIRRF